jgi:hypothetical protein
MSSKVEQTNITHAKLVIIKRTRKLSKYYSAKNIQISGSQIFYHIKMRITVPLQLFAKLMTLAKNS